MSGGRRPQAEAYWQAPLASGPLDALVGQQFHNVTLGYEHGFGDVTRWLQESDRWGMTMANYDTALVARDFANSAPSNELHIMESLMDIAISNPAIKPILRKVIAKHNPTLTV
jgi:hypothetical protein